MQYCIYTVLVSRIYQNNSKLQAFDDPSVFLSSHKSHQTVQATIYYVSAKRAGNNMHHNSGPFMARRN